MSSSQSNTRAYLLLLVGLIAGSLAAIFTRYAENEGIPGLVIATGRLVLSSLVLTPFALSRYGAEMRKLRRRDLLFVAAGGVWLAMHFILYITGLEHTSVLVGVVLGAITPLIAALLDMFVLKGNVAKATWIGLACAFVGVMCIAAAAQDERVIGGQNALFGSILGLLGSAAAAVYMTIGRKVRAQMSAIPYIYLVFSFASITALVVVFITHTPITGYTTNGYFWIMMLAIFPQLIGHSAFNILLSRFSATYIGLAGQTQIVVATLLAFLLFKEVPLPLQIIGGLAIIGGVVVATLGQQRQPAAQPLPENAVPAPAGD